MGHDEGPWIGSEMTTEILLRSGMWNDWFGRRHEIEVPLFLLRHHVRCDDEHQFAAINTVLEGESTDNHGST